MTSKHEYHPPTSDPHIPDIRSCGCAACRENAELRAEIERLDKALGVETGWRIQLQAEIERLKRLYDDVYAENQRLLDNA